MHATDLEALTEAEIIIKNNIKNNKQAVHANSHQAEQVYLVVGLVNSFINYLLNNGNQL